MKYYLLLMCTLLLARNASSQVNVVQSRFSYQRTVSLMGAVIDSKTEDLFYNGKESVYVSYAKDLIPPTDSTITSTGGDRMTIEWAGVADDKDFIMYKNYGSNTMQFRTAFSNGKLCIVTDTIPTLIWKYGTEKKRIGPYMCQRAKTVFHCAEYTAWFTTDIPLSIGPWKLGGLPGIIVELMNERAHVSYKLITAEYPKSKQVYVISPPKTGDPTYSWANYGEIEAIEQDKQRKFLAILAKDPNDPTIFSQNPECLKGK